MTVPEAIYSALTGNAAVAALVANRIYPATALPAGVVAPYVIYQHISSDPAVSHGEAAGAINRLFQFACFARTSLEAEELRDAVTAALDSVPLGNGESPTLEDERSGGFEEAVELYRADCDFLI